MKSQKRNLYEKLHNYYKPRQEALKTKVKSLAKELEDAKAQVALYKKMLFGKKSESSNRKYKNFKKGKNKRKRGQQKGSRGHGRTKLDLPIEEEFIDTLFA